MRGSRSPRGQPREGVFPQPDIAFSPGPFFASFCPAASFFSCVLASYGGCLLTSVTSPTLSFAFPRPHSGAALPWVLSSRTTLAAAGYKEAAPPLPPCPALPLPGIPWPSTTTVLSLASLPLATLPSSSSCFLPSCPHRLSSCL